MEPPLASPSALQTRCRLHPCIVCFETLPPPPTASQCRPMHLCFPLSLLGTPTHYTSHVVRPPPAAAPIAAPLLLHTVWLGALFPKYTAHEARFLLTQPPRYRQPPLHVSALLLKTHQTVFRIPVRVSCLHHWGNFDMKPRIGCMWFQLLQQSVDDHFFYCSDRDEISQYFHSVKKLIFCRGANCLCLVDLMHCE